MVARWRLIEAVDVNQTGDLEHYSAQLEETASTIAQRLDDQNKQVDGSAAPGSGDLELSSDAIVDLVLRQPYEVDETFEVAPAEWSVLNGVNGDRPLRAVAEQANMPVSQVARDLAALLERGLIRLGKENRRRL